MVHLTRVSDIRKLSFLRCFSWFAQNAMETSLLYFHVLHALVGGRQVREQLVSHGTTAWRFCEKPLMHGSETHCCSPALSHAVGQRLHQLPLSMTHHPARPLPGSFLRAAGHSAGYSQNPYRKPVEASPGSTAGSIWCQVSGFCTFNKSIQQGSWGCLLSDMIFCIPVSSLASKKKHAPLTISSSKSWATWCISLEASRIRRLSFRGSMRRTMRVSTPPDCSVSSLSPGMRPCWGRQSPCKLPSSPASL